MNDNSARGWTVFVEITSYWINTRGWWSASRSQPDNNNLMQNLKQIIHFIFKQENPFRFVAKIKVKTLFGFGSKTKWNDVPKPK